MSHAALFFFLALKLSILPTLSCCLDVLGGYLMPCIHITRLPDLDVGPMIIRRSQIKISKGEQVNDDTAMNSNHLLRVVAAACVPLQRRGELRHPLR